MYYSKFKRRFSPEAIIVMLIGAALLLLLNYLGVIHLM